MKILVTLDGHTTSETILPIAAVVAKACQAEVLLLSTTDDEKLHMTTDAEFMHSLTPMGDFSGGRLPVSEPEVRSIEGRGQALERIRLQWIDYLEDRGRQHFAEVKATAHFVWAKDPATAILDFAREHGVDLIAMATHGRTGLGRLLAGSVTEGVLRSGVAPVLTVRPGEHVLKREG